MNNPLNSDDKFEIIFWKHAGKAVMTLLLAALVAIGGGVWSTFMDSDVNDKVFEAQLQEINRRLDTMNDRAERTEDRILLQMEQFNRRLQRMEERDR